MAEEQVINVEKKLGDLGEEMAQVVRETYENVEEVSPSIMHNLIRIFYEFFNRLLNVQALSPSKSLENELKRLDDRIREAKQIVEKTGNQINQSKDHKSRKLLTNKLASTKAELEYLERVKEALDEDGNRKHVLEFLEKMLYLVYGGHNLTLQEFRSLGMELNNIIVLMTGSLKSGGLTSSSEVSVTALEIRKRSWWQKLMARFSLRKEKKEQNILGLPEEGMFSEPTVPDQPVTEGSDDVPIPGILPGAEGDAAPAEVQFVSPEVPNPDEAIPLPESRRRIIPNLFRKRSSRMTDQEIGSELDHLSELREEMISLKDTAERVETIRLLDDEIGYIRHLGGTKKDDLMEILTQFVQEKRKEGYSDSAISTALQQKNWPREMIQKGIEA